MLSGQGSRHFSILGNHAHQKIRGHQALISIFIDCRPIAAVVFCASGASAMPVLSQTNSIARPEIAIEVKIICEQDGYCHQRGRRPVARWVYGEGNFDEQ